MANSLFEKQAYIRKYLKYAAISDGLNVGYIAPNEFELIVITETCICPVSNHTTADAWIENIDKIKSEFNIK